MKNIFILLIKIYRKYISGLFGSNKCRFSPTCSEYALQAFEKYNIFKALFLTIWRILRCNPFSKGGHDPLK